jgi:hypothetical protein
MEVGLRLALTRLNKQEEFLVLKSSFI